MYKNNRLKVRVLELILDTLEYLYHMPITLFRQPATPMNFEQLPPPQLPLLRQPNSPQAQGLSRLISNIAKIITED